MTTLFVSTWTCILIFAALVFTKYRKSIPPWPVVSAFMAAGALATAGALWTNMFLIQHTQFKFVTGSFLHRILSFFLGAGCGEEFWKFSFGLIAMMAPRVSSPRVGNSGRLLGFVTLGLTFAAIENCIYAQDLDIIGMLQRGYLAVPIHASMGMIHGVAANRALKAESPIPLFVGYVVAVFFHTLYDIINIVLLEVMARSGFLEAWPDFSFPVEFTLGPIVAILVAWCTVKWFHVAELSSESERESLDHDWYAESEKWERRRYHDEVS